MTNKTVFIVEDDEKFSSIYQNELTSLQVNVVVMKDGEATLHALNQDQPDLLLLDVMLNGKLNGFDVLEQVKRDPKLSHIPVIMMTNLDSEEKVAREIGAVDYIVKASISIAELKQKIAAYL